MNTYERFWHWRHEDKTLALAEDERIAFSLLTDMIGRRGFGGIWETVDEITRNEMLETWLLIINGKEQPNA